MDNTREKLIELLTDRIPGCDNELRYVDDERVERLADHLIANGVTVQKWIPVTERLPKHGEIVLCYLKFEEARILQWDNVSAWWLGYGSGDDWRKMDVTHWMPLPEQPKGERL